MSVPYDPDPKHYSLTVLYNEWIHKMDILKKKKEKVMT